MEAWPVPRQLSDAEIADRARRPAGLGARRATRSSATFECASFPDAIAFVVRIGFLAEAANHHPDLDIRWRKVRVALDDARRRRAHRSSTSTSPREITQACSPSGRRELTCRSRIAIGIILVLLVVHVDRVREASPGPGPADVAIAYESAWDKLDFDLLYDLSGDELRDGLRRDRVHRRQAGRVRRRPAHARIGADSRVDDVVATRQTAIVATRVTTDEGSVHNRVMLEQRATGWMVVGYSIRAG